MVVKYNTYTQLILCVVRKYTQNQWKQWEQRKICVLSCLLFSFNTIIMRFSIQSISSTLDKEVKLILNAKNTAGCCVVYANICCYNVYFSFIFQFSKYTLVSISCWQHVCIVLSYLWIDLECFFPFLPLCFFDSHFNGNVSL